MKIVLFGATGIIGRRIAKEAADRGHEVVGVVRDPQAAESPDPRVTLVRGDATDPASVAAVARGADAIVSAISPRPNARGLPAPSLPEAARALIEGGERANVRRLVVVGGAATLEVAPGVQALDTPEFPEAWKGEATQGRDALAVYRNEGGTMEWTFLSPAMVIEPGERTGEYRVGGEQMLFDESGTSFISAEDYAVALVDELEQSRHVQKRFTVAY
jgi:hypothetical protein